MSRIYKIFKIFRIRFFVVSGPLESKTEQDLQDLQDFQDFVWRGLKPRLPGQGCARP